MAFPFGFQALEHLALEGPRLEIEVEDRSGFSGRRCPHRAVKTIGIASANR